VYEGRYLCIKGRGGGWLLAAWPEMDSRSLEIGNTGKAGRINTIFPTHTTVQYAHFDKHILYCMDEGIIKTQIPKCRLYWCFCLRWCTRRTQRDSSMRWVFGLIKLSRIEREDINFFMFFYYELRYA
jgi:hypothetical protein